MGNRPTLKTIGQLAGLSHVAVSKALRDAPDISEATKARVKKIAREVGYTPNLAARNLYLQRTSTIGMVVPAMGENTAYDLIFNEVSAAAAASVSIFLFIVISSLYLCCIGYPTGSGYVTFGLGQPRAAMFTSSRGR